MLLRFLYCLRQNIYGLILCDENLFATHRGVSGHYRSAPGFPPDRSKRGHGHGDGWQWWILFHTFFRDDSHRRYGALDVELEWT
jgi:hypothetical protein